MFKNIKNFFDTAKINEDENQEYLDEDIFAVLSLLIEASKIDGIVSNDEIDLIKKILITKFHLNPQKAEKSIDFVLHKSDEKIEIYSDIKVILDSMDHDERISVIEMLWEIILSDGKVDEYEANLIWRICGLLHVSGTESSMAKKRALGN
jgi:uncharacterized tellurite resistance protein B-like protein